MEAHLRLPPGWTRERDSGLLTTIGWDLPPLVGM